jgi:hypothetical protein
VDTQGDPYEANRQKTEKNEPREMLTEAVRNTQSEPKRRPKAKKDRGQFVIVTERSYQGGSPLYN